MRIQSPLLRTFGQLSSFGFSDLDIEPSHADSNPCLTLSSTNGLVPERTTQPWPHTMKHAHPNPFVDATPRATSLPRAAHGPAPVVAMARPARARPVSSEARPGPCPDPLLHDTREREPDKAGRQSAFIDALLARGDIEIDFGHFLSKPVTCRSCGSTWQKNEEKKTDVNIAVRLLEVAYDDRFDVAVVISGDSDLVPPIEASDADSRPNDCSSPSAEATLKRTPSSRRRSVHDLRSEHPSELATTECCYSNRRAPHRPTGMVASHVAISGRRRGRIGTYPRPIWEQVRRTCRCV